MHITHKIIVVSGGGKYKRKKIRETLRKKKNYNYFNFIVIE